MAEAPSVDELKRSIETLKGNLQFGPARKLLAEARERNPNDIWIAQQLSLCTYKDEELLPATRFSDALKILDSIGLRDARCKNTETLALGGAVYKRMWENAGQLEHLYESLAFYRSAYERNPEADMGYGGINAAYILDLLASRARTVARRTGIELVEAGEFARQAKELRERMLKHIPPLAEKNTELKKKYWFVTTVAEIHFGLGNYQEAAEWLSLTRELGAREWERQTTFRQFVSIARHQGRELPKEHEKSSSWHPAWQALTGMLGEDTGRALSCYRGKIGLALSGGGFRASFYHLGVLARLAEMDVLRYVEVLSTVSGGSIVGAHYYLEVRSLLQTVRDLDIQRDAYIEIVGRVQSDFLLGVQRNLRTRALASFPKNLKMIFSGSYSRSHRLGELYEEELYARVQDGHPVDRPRLMPELLIRPAGEPDREHFKPKFSNWRRRAKVPVLLLNTTSLNSGHNWQFTATWMGEPPGLVGDEVDKKERYRRLYYDQAPTEELKNYRLGYAVAASACVPGLFEPLVIDGLFPDRAVRLVDGGVHDNQGVAGLLDESCTLILCSDASGQLEDRKDPSDGVIGVLTRSGSIQGECVREAQYQDLRGRADSRSLHGLFFVHLKKDLPVFPLDWIKCPDPSPKLPYSGAATPYGVDWAFQRNLAAIRTDLDSFTEVEAYSLMLSGYLVTEHEFKQLQKQHVESGEPSTWGGFDIDAPQGDWPFLKLESLLRQPPGAKHPQREDLSLQLEVASCRLFKVWKLYPSLRWLSRIGLGAGILVTLWLVVRHWSTPIVEGPIAIGAVVLFLLLAVLGLVVPASKWILPEQAMRGILRKTTLALLGYISAQVHLRLFDWLYLRRGSLERLLQLPRR